MTSDEYSQIKPKHTLSKLNKALCRLLVLIMIVMFISYYITTLMQVKLTKLSSETVKLNNENIELQNKLDNLMSYHNVEEAVKRTGKLESARQVLDIDYNPKAIPKNIKKKPVVNYYHWSLGF